MKLFYLRFSVTRFLMLIVALIVALILVLAVAFLAGCAPSATGAKPTSGNAMSTVANLATTAPGLAKQFDDVYAYLVQQKLVPDHLDAASKALATMDAVAPLVQAGVQSLSGDNFNWASFVLQAAVTAAQVMGYVLPLVL